VPTAWEANVKEVGERLTTGPPPPVRLTVCVPGVALSETLSLPVLVPLAVGLKVTLIVHAAPTVSRGVHVWVCEKSPLVAILKMVRAAVPVLLRVTL